jgi:hypothetical protein
MFDIRTQVAPEGAECKGCGLTSHKEAWYRLLFAFLASGETDTIWLCLECGKNIGALLLRDYLI